MVPEKFFRTLRELPLLAPLLIGLVCTAPYSDGAEPATDAAASTAAPVGPKPAWRVDKSDVRLLALPALSTNHTMRLDIPESLQDGCKSVAVYDFTSKPTMMAFYPVVVNDRYVAVEISVTKKLINQMEQQSTSDDRAAVGIQCYLLKTPDNRTYSEQHRRPIGLRLERHTRHKDKPNSIVARPLTCDHFRRLTSRVRPGQFRFELQVFPNERNVSAFKKQIGKHQLRRYQMHTLLRVDQTEIIEFAVRNNDSGAWFLDIDDQCAGSWATMQRNGYGYLSSGPITFDPGFHDLILGGIIASNEQMPDLVWSVIAEGDRVPFSFIDSKRLYTANRTGTVLVEHRDDVVNAGAQLRYDTRIRFAGVDTELVTTTVHDLSRHLFGREIPQRRLQIDDLVLDNPPKTSVVLLSSQAQHEVKMKVVDAQGYEGVAAARVAETWAAPKDAHLRFNIGELPVFAPIDVPWQLTYDVENVKTYEPSEKAFLPSTSRTIMERLEFVVRYYDSDDRIIEVVRKPLPRAPHERIFTYDFSDTAVHRLELACAVRDHPVAPPINIYLLDSMDTGSFAQSVGRLRHQGGFAVLRREDLMKGVASADLNSVSDFLLVDDFIAAARHPTDDLSIVDWAAGNLNLTIQHLPLPPYEAVPGNALIRTFEALDDVALSPASAVIWNIGMHGLTAGSDLRDFQSHLTFLINYTWRHGKTPVLVTPPVTPEFKRRDLRPYALMIMELGETCGIPVIDYYSATLMRGSIAEFYMTRESQPVLLSSVPSASGRIWFLKQLAENIKRYRGYN